MIPFEEAVQGCRPPVQGTDVGVEFGDVRGVQPDERGDLATQGVGLPTYGCPNPAPKAYARRTGHPDGAG